MGFQDAKPFPPESLDSSAADVGGGGTLADASNRSDVPIEAGEGGCSHPQCGGCVDIATDPKNCGACNHDCTALMHIGSADGITCAAGRCVVPPTSCASGYAHCSANADDGCETDIGTAAHCGSCTKQCSVDAPLCAAAQCVTSCPAATPTVCGSACINLDTDPGHCGDCTKACPRPATGGNATCSAKICGFSCLANWHSCPGTPDCAPDTDTTRCGPTCMKCPGTSDGDPNGDAVCLNNQCSIQCHTNYTKCSSGTCVDAANDPRNCGQCGHDCTALANIGSATGIRCSAGSCVIPSSACSPGHAHCTSNPDDGCETDTTNPANCNGCGNQCPLDNPICAPTGCKNACPATASTLCNGTTCANLDNDANHCSDCAKACVQPASGGTTTCDSRACVVHCFSGSPECAGSCPDYQSDSQNCGTCGHVCSNGTTCKSGVCCGPTQTNCGGTCSDTSSDPDHCGACTNAVCPDISGGTRNCVNKVCSTTCNTGRLLCGGTCCPLPPPNATMSCDVGICTPHCLGLTLSCSGGSTQCGSWNFESNTGEGWQPDLAQIGTATNFQIKSAPGGSLAFSFNVNNTGDHVGTTIRVPLCNGQVSSAKGHLVTAQVYAEGPPFQIQSNMENSVNFSWTDFSGNGGGTQFYLFYPANTWVTVGDLTIPQPINIDAVAYLWMTVYVDRVWTGTIYVDNIQLH